MSDIRRQVISVNGDNDPNPEKIPVIRNIPLPQLEDENNWRSEGIIFPRQSNNLHNANATFRNYSREEVMKMTKLDFLIFFLLNI